LDTVKVTAYALGGVGAILLVSVVGVLVSPPAPAATMAPMAPSKVLTLYALETPDGTKFAFATDPNDLASLGKPIAVKVGDVVKVVMKNVGKLPHSFAILSAPQSGATELFEAAIGSAAKPIFPNEEGSVVFKADKAGKFAYACTVPGHIQLGMVGDFVVEP